VAACITVADFVRRLCIHSATRQKSVAGHWRKISAGHCNLSFIYSFITGCTALCGPWPPLFGFLTSSDIRQDPRTSQGHYLHRTTQHRHKDKHPCPKRGSSPRSSVRALKAHASDRHHILYPSKVVPLRSLGAHLGERRYSSYSFLTSALEGGEWSASRPGRALPPGKEPPVPTAQQAGWAPEPV
jgi:hypothetical protein